ncbi:S-layer homology domain-containing protein [Tindallia magadiensis]|uniref:S-layer homology domain-containing protein n=1 Tax=Tindallia magadiensis TaxID=69895 RepID=A0A1I3D128_9FIRM|nr:S-layer homology domain-containing protein [Tindallia magadiensis]SFH80171.1 S-layer homology domain-containing protein [Tindallia magadiensis]
MGTQNKRMRKSQIDQKKYDPLHTKKQAVAMVLMVLIMATSLFPVTAATPFTSVDSYRGLPGAVQKVRDMNYTDIGDHWAAESILDITGLGVMSGTGNRQFAPNRSITAGEALMVLLKARGMEEELQEAVAEQDAVEVAGVPVGTEADRQLVAAVELAQQENILTEEEAADLLELSDEETDRLDEEVNKAVDEYLYSELTSPELTELENALRNQMETRKAWNRPAQRQQVAAWFARTLNLEPAEPSQTPQLARFNDRRQIDEEKRPLIEAALQANYISGTSENTFSPAESMSRAQMAALMMKSSADWLPQRGITPRQGKVSDLRMIETPDNPQTRTRQITVKHPDNTSALLELTQREDLPVRRRNQIYLSDQIFDGDPVTYYSTDENHVKYMTVTTSLDGEASPVLTGFIESIDPNTRTLKVRDFNDREHHLKVPPGTGVTINGRLAIFEDLPHGLEVTISRLGNTVNTLQGTLEEDPDRHGYIPPESRFKVGDVLFFDENSIEIQNRGTRETFQITNNTQILRDGSRAPVHQIKTGDRVLLLFDDIYSPEIATIRVEDDERHITDMIRATIDSVDNRAGEVLLRDIQRFDENRWVPHSDSMVQYRANNGQLFEGASEITLAQLDRMKGQQIYAAVEESYGRPRIAKLQTQNGSTQTYDSRIQRLEFATEELEVDYNRFNFHPGTIVIQNNRLVDRLNLDKDQNIYMLADMSPTGRNAAMISITDQGMLDPRPGGTRLVIYQARLQDLFDYQVELGRIGYQLDYLRLEENRWESLRSARRAIFSEDTLIYDSELEEAINPGVFLDTRFIDPQDIENRQLRERIEDRFYYDKTAYFLIRETDTGNSTHREALAINLAPRAQEYEGGTMATEHSAMGVVDTVDLDNNSLTLNNVRNWNGLSRRWEPVRSRQEFDTHTAVILLNDDPITAEEMYRIRSGAQAYVIQNRTASDDHSAYVIVIEQ